MMRSGSVAIQRIQMCLRCVSLVFIPPESRIALRQQRRTARRAPFAEIRHPKKRAFLVLYTRNWREDAVFQAALKQVEAAAADLLEQEAYRGGGGGGGGAGEVVQGRSWRDGAEVFGRAADLSTQGVAA